MDVPPNPPQKLRSVENPPNFWLWQRTSAVNRVFDMQMLTSNANPAGTFGQGKFSCVKPAPTLQRSHLIERLLA